MTLRDCKVFEPAIARLREELANFEQQAAGTRVLIEALVVRAKAEVADPARVKSATAKALPRGPHRSSRATSDKQKHGPAPASPQMPAVATATDSATQLTEIVAAVARSRRDVEAAIRSKDAARLKVAIATIVHAERRGGEILIKLGGALKPLPISQADRKRWREAAARSPTAFEAKLKRDVAKALASIGGSGADAATVDKAKAPSHRSTSARSPAKLGRVAPQLQNKLSDWHKEADGSLTRTLTSVDDAAVPAGA